VVVSAADNPLRQFAAAWQAAAAVAAEWAERTAAVTAEAFGKLASDPAIRSVLAAWRITAVWPGRACECPCAAAHPGDAGVCDTRAVITRRRPAGPDGGADVPLCAPCAVAQGVAELPK
jgi:hypothetical protein